MLIVTPMVLHRKPRIQLICLHLVVFTYKIPNNTCNTYDMHIANVISTPQKQILSISSKKLSFHFLQDTYLESVRTERKQIQGICLIP